MDRWRHTSVLVIGAVAAAVCEDGIDAAGSNKGARARVSAVVRTDGRRHSLRRRDAIIVRALQQTGSRHHHTTWSSPSWPRTPGLDGRGRAAAEGRSRRRRECTVGWRCLAWCSTAKVPRTGNVNELNGFRITDGLNGTDLTKIGLDADLQLLTTHVQLKLTGSPRCNIVQRRR